MTDGPRNPPGAPPEAPRPVGGTAVTLPHTVELPARYYSPFAVQETIRAFAEVAAIESRAGDGVLQVTFQRIDAEAGEVIAEFLNHALYASATAVEEASR